MALRTVLISAAIGLGGSFLAALALQIIDAQPMPFLSLTVGLLLSFGAGLYSRTLRVDGLPKLPAALIGTLVATLSVIAGLWLSATIGESLAPTLRSALHGVLGPIFGAGSEIAAPKAPAALSNMLQTGAAWLLVGFAIAGFYSSRASIPFLFLGIPLALYFVWIIGPTFVTGYLSFTNWDGASGIDQAPWVGFENYERLMGHRGASNGVEAIVANIRWMVDPKSLPAGQVPTDRNFWIAIGNNIKWLAFFLIIPTSMGLGMAMIFNGKFPGARIFKIAFYSPLVIAPVVVGLVWQNMYLPESGLINSLLLALGVSKEALPGWLADPSMSIWAIIIAAGWRQVGYVMILYLAGLKSLDTTLIEASIVDGANPWQRFRKVIFPLLGPVTVVVAVISVIDSLRAFDLVAIMTRGGPANSSEVMANFMYIQAFNNYRMGYAGAIAMVLLGLMLVFIIPYLIRTARTELEY